MVPVGRVDLGVMVIKRMVEGKEVVDVKESAVVGVNVVTEVEKEVDVEDGEELVSVVASGSS